MKFLDRAFTGFCLGILSISVPGCMENIALVGRPSIVTEQSDVVGEVQRVDMSLRRIYLRPDRGVDRVVVFSENAQVLDRGREYPVTRLEPGDIVATQLRRNSRGEFYADLIRVQENVRDRRGIEVSESAPQIQTLSGRIDRVDSLGNSFDLMDQPGKPLLVVLSTYVRDSDRERFRNLRSGDRVRIEGKFTGPDRFELLSFLNEGF